MKMKVPYNIRKSLARVLPFAMLMGVPAMNSCEKEPGRTVIIDWDYGKLPRSDTVALCAKQKDVDSIIFHLTKTNVSGFSPWGFHNLRDSLQKRIDIAPSKIRGRGTIIVGSELGAQHSSYDIEDYELGMALEDSIWYTSWGFRVMTEQAR